MHFCIYDVYYSQFSRQHPSAGEKIVVVVLTSSFSFMKTGTLLDSSSMLERYEFSA
jgi:hypothetical protein